MDDDPALLTNSEVLEVLTSRDSDKQAAILPSEVKVNSLETYIAFSNVKSPFQSPTRPMGVQLIFLS